MSLPEVEYEVKPESTYALVVAIEKYEDSYVTSLTGLVKDAINFVDWLLERKVKPENIFLFLSSLDSSEQDKLVQTIEKKHSIKQKHSIKLTIQPAKQDNIKNIIHKKIQQRSNENRTFHLFWSGHGFMIDSTQHLMCSDASEDQLKNLNISSLIQALIHSDEPYRFSNQIYYIDTCATNVTFGISNGEGRWEHSEVEHTEAHQIKFAVPPRHTRGSENDHYALFAASVGNEAIGDKERAISFSKAVLKAIQDQPLLPEMHTVKDRVISWLKERLQDKQAECGEVMIKYCWRENVQEYTERLYRGSSLTLNLMGDLICSSNKIKGRDREIKQLETLIFKPGNKIVGIAGLPGVGKSALASYFAEKEGHRFPDGVIGLRVDDKDIKTIAHLVAEYCEKQVSRNSRKGVTEIMRDSLRNKQLLLIFDNADQAQDTSKIKELCRGINSCPVLITSRDHNILRDSGIREIEDNLIELKILSREAALEILEGTIGKQRLRQELEAAEKIAELLGRLPLALKLAGNTLEEISETYPNLQAYADKLNEARKNLHLPKDLAPEALTEEEAEKSIRCSFDLSFKKIKPEQVKAFFSSLSVCAGLFTLAEAKVVSNTIDIEKTEEYLTNLRRRSLLERTGSQPPFQYEFHPLVRQFAFEKLEKLPALQQETEERYADYFIALVRQSQSNKIWQRLEGLLQVAQWMNKQLQPAYNFARYLTDLFDKQGRWEYAVQFFAEFCQLAIQRTDWEEAIEFGIQQAKFLRHIGKWNEALVLINILKNHCVNIANPDMKLFYQAQLLVEQGGNLQRMSQFENAIQVFTNSLIQGRLLYEKERNQKYTRHLAIVLNSRGDCLKQMGGKFLQQAIEDFQASLTCGRELIKLEESAFLKISKRNGEKHIGMVLNSLGMAYMKLANHCRKIGKDEKKSRLSFTQKTKDKYHETLKIAEQYLKDSLEIRTKLDDRRSQAITWDGLGQVYQKQKRYQEAEVAFSDSIKIDRDIGNPRGEATARTNRISLWCEIKRFEAAVEDFREAERLLLSINDQTGLAKLYNRSNQIYKLMAQATEGEDAQNKLKQAVKSMLNSVEMNTKLKQPEKGLLLIMGNLIELLEELTYPQDALQYCNTAIDLIEACEKLKNSSQLNQYLNRLLILRRNLQA